MTGDPGPQGWRTAAHICQYRRRLPLSGRGDRAVFGTRRLPLPLLLASSLLPLRGRAPLGAARFCNGSEPGGMRSYRRWGCSPPRSGGYRRQLRPACSPPWQSSVRVTAAKRDVAQSQDGRGAVRHGNLLEQRQDLLDCIHAPSGQVINKHAQENEGVGGAQEDRRLVFCC